VLVLSAIIRDNHHFVYWTLRIDVHSESVERKLTCPLLVNENPQARQLRDRWMVPTYRAVSQWWQPVFNPIARFNREARALPRLQHDGKASEDETDNSADEETGDGTVLNERLHDKGLDGEKKWSRKLASPLLSRRQVFVMTVIDVTCTMAMPAPLSMAVSPRFRPT